MEEKSIINKGKSGNPDLEEVNKTKKKSWMWVADAIVWTVCVAALVWVLSTTRTGVMRYTTFDNEYAEYGADSFDYVHEVDN